MDALAIAISIALQYGAPISLFIEKFVHTKFEPAGLTGDASFPMVSSPLDMIAKWWQTKFGEKSNGP